MERIILIGAGGHSKSVADSIDTNSYDIVGFIDENKTGFHLGKPILGKKIEDIPEFRTYKYFVSIGDIVFRKKWYSEICRLHLDTINIIDKTAVISSSAKLGTGNFVGKCAVINADVIIGDDNVINTKALIEHECVVGSHTHLSTNSAINGNVIVEDCVFIGSSAVCIGQLKVGKNTVIGAGSVIIKDVEPNVTVVGVPGRVIKRRD